MENTKRKDMFEQIGVNFIHEHCHHLKQIILIGKTFK